MHHQLSVRAHCDIAILPELSNICGSRSCEGSLTFRERGEKGKELSNSIDSLYDLRMLSLLSIKIGHKFAFKSIVNVVLIPRGLVYMRSESGRSATDIFTRLQCLKNCLADGPVTFEMWTNE